MDFIVADGMNGTVQFTPLECRCNYNIIIIMNIICCALSIN